VTATDAAMIAEPVSSNVIRVDRPSTRRMGLVAITSAIAPTHDNARRENLRSGRAKPGGTDTLEYRPHDPRLQRFPRCRPTHSAFEVADDPLEREGVTVAAEPTDNPEAHSRTQRGVWG